MIIGKKEKDRSGFIGKDLICFNTLNEGQRSGIKKGGNNEIY
jgi:hypothetical protein